VFNLTVCNVDGAFISHAYVVPDLLGDPSSRYFARRVLGTDYGSSSNDDFEFFPSVASSLLQMQLR